MDYINQSKNDFVLHRSIFVKELHEAAITKDVPQVEKIINQLEQQHLKNYDFLLYDHNSKLDIDYVKAEHERELKEDNFNWAL